MTPLDVSIDLTVWVQSCLESSASELSMAKSEVRVLFLVYGEAEELKLCDVMRWGRGVTAASSPGRLLTALQVLLRCTGCSFRHRWKGARW